jgi:hypothetical protein
MIQKTMPQRPVELYFDSVNRIRDQKENADTLIGNKFSHPDLVIIQTGEHEGPGKSRADVAKAYRQYILVPYLKLSPRPLIICVGIWAPGNQGRYTGWVKDIDQVYAEVCSSAGIRYVSVEHVAHDPSCHGWGSSDGVRWHPNDKGMAGYARLLFASFKQIYKGNEAIK